MHFDWQQIDRLRKTIGFIWKSSPFWTVVNLLLILIKSVLTVLFFVVVKVLIDEFQHAIHLTDKESAFQVVFNVIAFVIGVFVLNSIASIISNLAKEKHSIAMNNYFTTIIQNKTIQLDYGFFEDSNYQNIYYRAISEVSFRPAKIFFGIAGLLQNLLTLLFLGLLIVSFHWLMILILPVIVLPIVWFRIDFSKKNYQLKQSQTEEERRLQYFNRILTGKEFAKELRVFNLGEYFQNEYQLLKDKLIDHKIGHIYRKTVIELFFQLFVTTVFLSLGVYLGYEAINGKISIGALAMFFLAFQRGYGYLQDILMRVGSLYEDNLFLKNLFLFLDLKMNDNADEQQPFPQPLKREIRFENLSFGYPHSSRVIFENLDFTIKKGETIALVGANGAGKTTLVKLLSGLYEPTNGAIWMDDVDLSKISRDSIASNVSVIFQDFILYNISARKNIWLGNTLEDINSDKIYKAAEDAGVHHTFKQFKSGYDTTLGTLFEGSEQLSQGEWQRVALARSFFNNSQLIILDEPTSSMDAHTEAHLLDHIKEIVADRTALIVSHRLSTIKMADRIVVIGNKQVLETGTLNELIERKGEFYNMMNDWNRHS